MPTWSRALSRQPRLDFRGHIPYDCKELPDLTAKPIAVTPSLAGELDARADVRLGVALHWFFRVGVLMEFLGHGLAGVSLKEGWIRYFQVFGFDRPTVLTLMPIVGTIDISLAILGFLSPRRWALAYCAFWGLMTAVLRPIAGESFWEVLDRAGNFGGPLAFLLLSGLPRNPREWFEPIRIGPVSRETMKRVALVLQWITGLVLIGHGAYGALLQKQQLLDQYTRAGLTSLPLLGSRFESWLGWVEMALGAVILVKPLRPLLLAACTYKLATELLYPLTGYPLYEFVERGFTYVAPFALFLLTPYLNATQSKG